MPLYMEAIMAILRSMQDDFDYSAFRAALQSKDFNRSQMAMLDLRLSLLDSCLDGGTRENSASTHFKKGQLTIIECVISAAMRRGANIRVWVPAYHLRSWMGRPRADFSI